MALLTIVKFERWGGLRDRCRGGWRWIRMRNRKHEANRQERSKTSGFRNIKLIPSVVSWLAFYPPFAPSQRREVSLALHSPKCLALSDFLLFLRIAQFLPPLSSCLQHIHTLALFPRVESTVKDHMIDHRQIAQPTSPLGEPHRWEPLGWVSGSAAVRLFSRLNLGRRGLGVYFGVG